MVFSRCAQRHQLFKVQGGGEILEPQAYVITCLCNHCNISPTRMVNTSQYVDTVTIFQKQIPGGHRFLSLLSMDMVNHGELQFKYSLPWQHGHG